MLDYRAVTFLAICRCGSYTKAADELHLSQPAVSQHIRQLEQRYGARLFERDGRSMRRTAAGELLFSRLDAIDHDEGRIARELAALDEGGDGDHIDALNFGCTKTVGDYVAPALLTSYLANHHRARIRMTSGNTDALVRGILAGDIDFALVEGSFDRGKFDSALLSHESYIAVARPGMVRDVCATCETDTNGAPLPACPESIDQLLGQRLVLRERGSGTRQIVEHVLAARGLGVSDFQGTLELGTIPAIKACVEAGFGITFLYRVAVERELAAGTLEDVTPHDFELAHDFRLIWQRGSQYAARWRALAAAWREELRR